MTELYFIRHGESVCNQKRVFTGHIDAELTEKGLNQGRYACSYFKNMKVDAIYASALKRTADTVSALAEEQKLDIIKVPELNEIYAGKWGGTLISEIEKNYPEEYTAWINDIGSAVCTDGESVRDLGERVYNKIKEIAEKNNDNIVVISTHATPIRSFLSIVKTGDVCGMKDIPWVSNASVTKVTYENGSFSINLENETSHLKGLLSTLPENI